MSWWKAFLAGIFGATLISIMLGAANLAGFHVLDFSMMWGTLVGLPIGWKAWVAGFCIHLVVGGIFALIYAGLFKVFSGAGLLRGSLFGVAHAAVTGIFLPLMPLVNPLMNNGHMQSPRAYFGGHGIPGILFYFGIHVVYGATVGWFYQRQIPQEEIVADSGNLHIAA